MSVEGHLRAEERHVVGKEERRGVRRLLRTTGPVNGDRVAHCGKGRSFSNLEFVRFAVGRAGGEQAANVGESI